MRHHQVPSAQWLTAAKRKAAAEATSAAAKGADAAPAAETGLGAGASAAEATERATAARTATTARAFDPTPAIACCFEVLEGSEAGDVLVRRARDLCWWWGKVRRGRYL